MLPERLEQAFVAKFLSRLVECFGRAVGLEHQGIAREELAILDRAIPIIEKPHHRGR